MYRCHLLVAENLSSGTFEKQVRREGRSGKIVASGLEGRCHCPFVDPLSKAAADLMFAMAPSPTSLAVEW